ncbi:MAG TPA: Rieske 2Fe-2S domain-containing protein [Chloroflexota bacterium]|jgi:nitrite reductase/ring-hydroxylating ferredoxin subunit
MAEALESASQERVHGLWPRYDAAVLGFRNYWYPVLFARDLGRKPRSVTICGERIVLVRDGGRVYALHDRCPHRGVPLSAGRCAFPGLLTCAYHGWTYDLATGDLVAALTDGPDSPIVGKASVRVPTYPVEERGGLLWVWVGDAPPVPVEEDVPEDILRPGAVVQGVIFHRPGNWRYAVENGIDEGHSRYLHRDALWTYLRKMPAWTHGVRLVPSDDGKWMWRVRDKAVFEAEYPRIGRWPPRERRRIRSGGGIYHRLGIRLPATLVSGQDWGNDYQIWVPVDADHHLAVLLSVSHASGPAALWFRLRYRLWVRWLHHGQFYGQDEWMIGLMDCPPERLYRPDASITAWRRYCEEAARPQGPPRPLANGAAQPVAAAARSSSE